MEGRTSWRKSESEDCYVHDERREPSFNKHVAFVFASPRSLSFVFLVAPSPRSYLTWSFDPVFD